VPVRNAPGYDRLMCCCYHLSAGSEKGYNRVRPCYLRQQKIRLTQRNYVGLCFFDDARLNHIEMSRGEHIAGSQCSGLACDRKEKMLGFGSCRSRFFLGGTNHQQSTQLSPARPFIARGN
jgi:hypothetical protein